MIMYTQEQSCEPMLITVADHTFGKISRKRSRSEIQRTTSECVPVTKRRRTIKSVGFASTVDTVPSTSTDITTSATWYSDEEASQFLANVKRDVHHLAMRCKTNTVADMDCTEFCTTGLERFCCKSETRLQNKALKQRRVRAVFDMQYGQRQMGISDPESIRLAAQTFSRPATEKALALAARLVAC